MNERDAMTAALEAGCNVGADTARTLAEAAEPLWDAMAQLGWTDTYGGAECGRVLPEALSFIHREANRGPLETPTGW